MNYATSIKSRGFTLIELLLVIAIVALIGMSSFAFYSRFLTQSAVSDTSDKFTGQLRKAQMYAMSGKQNSNWGVHYASNQITLFSGNSYAARTPAFDETFTVNNNITVNGMSSDIIFTHMTGTASASTTVVVAGGGNSESIPVNVQGVVGGGSTISSGPWYNTAYLYKKKITIDKTKVSGGADLTNFPVLISVTDTDLRSISNGGSVSNSSGYDIIFTDSTETTKLDHEIEKYNPVTGETIIWVRLPTVSASVDTSLYVYFGNNAISTSQENKSGVWDSNYKGVWHLSENPAGIAPQIDDSTVYANDLTSFGTMTLGDQVTGKIDGSIDFDGVDDFLERANFSANITGISALTLEGWVYVPNNPGTHEAYFGIRNEVNADLYVLQIQTTNAIECRFRNSSGTTGTAGHSVTPNAWQFVGVVVNGSTTTCYANGLAGSGVASSGTIANTTVPFRIGNDGNNNYGTIKADEVRVSNTARSSGWIGTEYNNQNSPSTFYTIGTKTSQ